MITLRGLTKRYGRAVAVDDLTCEIAGGRVTGFLGPNGAGKSTTMRMILQLDRPTSGDALVHGQHYSDFPRPLCAVGALLDAKARHPRRSARNHLVAMARGSGIPLTRVDEMLDLVGLTDAANRPAGTFSLGMGQRLGIAGALLGDPGVLLFDEPVNGLDVDGVLWLRGLLRSLAAEGRTVLVSSHLMSEMQMVADHVVVLGQGKLLADAPIDQLITDSARGLVRVLLPELAHAEALQAHLADPRVVVRHGSPHELLIPGQHVERAGDLAYRLGLRMHGLRAENVTLEDAYLELTRGNVEYHSQAGV